MALNSWGSVAALTCVLDLGTQVNCKAAHSQLSWGQRRGAPLLPLSLPEFRGPLPSQLHLPDRHVMFQEGTLSS